MSAPLLSVSDLSASYGPIRALRGLIFHVGDRETVAIVGANGAGKSSLFRLLLGFETATAGSATILGCSSKCLTPAIRARIGFVNEEHTLPPWMRVDEVTNMQRRQYPQWSEQRHVAVLRNFNVMPTQRISQLSRGERAGVNLALALAQNPELLILDEPTLGLDVVAKRVFLGALMESSYAGDATIVYCSHQMDEIERVADQLIVLERGKLMWNGPPSDFCERIALWVAEFPFSAPDTSSLPGILQSEQIEGLSHYMVFGQDEQFGARLRLLGARSVHNMPVSLDRAVNAYLARGHIATAASVAAA